MSLTNEIIAQTRITVKLPNDSKLHRSGSFTNSGTIFAASGRLFEERTPDRLDTHCDRRTNQLYFTPAHVLAIWRFHCFYNLTVGKKN